MTNGTSQVAAVQHPQTGGSDFASNRQHSATDHFPCLRDATASTYQALVMQNNEIDRSIKDLSRVCLDDSEPQGVRLFPAECCHQTFSPTSPFEVNGATAHGSTADRVVVSALRDAMENDTAELADRISQGTCTPIATDGEKRKETKMGLLGESGEVIKAVHEALKEVEDVQRSDELMHFEFCGPFWELSQVFNTLLHTLFP
jgi:hypothetical protein